MMGRLSLISGLFGLAAGQVLKFEAMPVPEPYTLSTHYLFHVYAEKDAPAKRPGMGPAVEFRKLMARKTGKSMPDGYRSIQIGILPYDQMWTLLDKQRFCKGPDGQLALRTNGQSASDFGAHIETLPMMTADQGVTESTKLFPITKTGRYVLAFVNCGNFSEATVTGALAVRNAHGYLPGDEFHTMRLFPVFGIFYLLLNLVWLRNMIRYWKGLFYVHKGIGVVLFLALAECCCASAQYHFWNESGEFPEWLLIASVFCYTMKHVTAWRLLLMTALGAGITMEDLPAKTFAAFFLSTTLVLLQAAIWKLSMSYRYSHNLDTDLLMKITVPGVFVYAGMFLLGLVAVTRLISQVHSRSIEDLVKLFQKVRLVLAMVMGIASFVVVLQVADVFLGGDMLDWEHRWITVDGAPQLSFALALLGMAVVWWPKPDGWKYGYNMQLDEDGGEANEEGEVEKKSTKKVKMSKVKATPIGVAEQEEPAAEEDEA